MADQFNLNDLENMSKEQLIALRDQAMKKGQELGFIQPEDSLVKKGFHAGLKGLDYQRAGVQRGILEALGQSNLLTPEEKDANNPTNLQMAPSYGTVLQRKFGDFPGSGTLGFGLDVALDPLTYETGGAATLADLAKLPNVANALEKMAVLEKVPGAGEVLSKLGEKIYRSPFRKGDTEILEKIGPEAKKFSDVVTEQGFTGTRQSIHNQMNDYLDNLLTQQKANRVAAGEAGNTIDLNAALSEPKAYVAELKRRANPGDAAALEKKISQIEDAAEISKAPIPTASPEQAGGMKTEVWKSTPKNAFGQPAVTDSEAAGLLKIGGGLAQRLEGMAAPYGPTEAALNAEMRPIYTAAPKEKLQIRQENNQPFITGLDRNIAPIIMGTSDQGLVDVTKWGLLKKALDSLLYGTYAPTKLGKGLMQFGESGFGGPTVSRGVIDVGRPNASPWTLIPPDQGQ